MTVVEERFFSVHFYTFQFKNHVNVLSSQKYRQCLKNENIKERTQLIHWSWGTLTYVWESWSWNLDCIKGMISLFSSRISDQLHYWEMNSESSKDLSGGKGDTCRTDWEFVKLFIFAEQNITPGAWLKAADHGFLIGIARQRSLHKYQWKYCKQKHFYIGNLGKSLPTH